MLYLVAPLFLSRLIMLLFLFGPGDGEQPPAQSGHNISGARRRRDDLLCPRYEEQDTFLGETASNEGLWGRKHYFGFEIGRRLSDLRGLFVLRLVFKFLGNAGAQN